MKSVVILFLAGLLTPTLSIKCFRNQTSGAVATDCPTSGGVVNKAQSGIGSVWKWVKDGVQTVTGDDWIDDLGDSISNAIGVDITSHEKNKAWVQGAIKSIGLNFDVSGNCYVTFDKTSKRTLERGCGALGGVGTLGAELVKFMQGRKFNIWADNVCFTKPGSSDEEVCLCNTESCNEDYKSAMKAAGINPNAKAADCDGQECPLANLKKVSDNLDFNSACYTYTPATSETRSTKERCFTSDVVALPQAAKLTRSKRSVVDDGGEFKLTNIDGETKPFTGMQVRIGEEQPTGGSQETVRFCFYSLMCLFFILHLL